MSSPPKINCQATRILTRIVAVHRVLVKRLELKFRYNSPVSMSNTVELVLEDVTRLRWLGKLEDALSKLKLLLMSPISLQQRRSIASAKFTIFWAMGNYTRAEDTLSKCFLRVSSSLYEGMLEMERASHTTLIIKRAYIRMRTKGKIRQAIRVRDEFLTNHPDPSVVLCSDWLVLLWFTLLTLTSSKVSCGVRKS
jgi:hypothetical protein